MLTVNNLSFSYKDKPILNEICFSAKRGKITSIIGANGAGKSTLINCIAHILSPESGEIYLDKADTLKLNLASLAKLQAYVPQNSNTTFPITVEQYIMLGRKPYVKWSFTDNDKEIVENVMEYLNLCEFSQRTLLELSGGERQRVMLARAIAQQPKILLLDEPTSALDIKYQIEFMSILRNVAKNQACHVVIIMHDLQLITRYSDEVVLLHNGKVFKDGSVDDVITPTNIETAYGIHVEVLDTTHGKVVVPTKENEKA